MRVDGKEDKEKLGSILQKSGQVQQGLTGDCDCDRLTPAATPNNLGLALPAIRIYWIFESNAIA